ncbi:putative nuclease HARBI1 [Leptopilina heterotoma]|uniref:putative nuclease HARBI1 n=1 Tax=Leptopilina heterotoma TaxID=63436 RepID=UPI001CA937E3|nr:putative nuclease HARBI1 [Leptopilina heterotoma]XP_043476271.1 putative nuclease HARBI1 [Leptopilina heterotoma]
MTFANLIETIGPLLIRKDGGPSVLCPEKQLCIALWTYCNQEVYRSIADRFGVCKDTAWNCMLSVSKVLNTVSGDYIRWPAAENFNQTINKFLNVGPFPNVLAAVDGCHVEISAPCTNAASYINRKGYHSLLLQGMCDSQGKFVDVFAGVCGSVHDNRLFEMSPMGQQLITAPENVCPLDMHIIGDAAYKLHPFLMVPFKDNGHLTEDQINFNKCLSRTRMVIERAFGLLKGRFRRLLYLYLQNVAYGSLIIIACCVLHNICLDLDDDVNDEILNNIDEQRAQNIVNDLHDQDDVYNATALQKRRNIVNMLMQEEIRNQ